MNRKKMPRWLRIVLRIVAVIVILLLFAGGMLLGMREKGRRQMMEKTAVIPEIILEEETVSENAPVAAKEEKPLKEGEILYNGKKYEYRRDVMSILVMGIDKKAAVSAGKDAMDGGQADALFLLLTDPEEERIYVVGINRNSMADVDVFDREGTYSETRMMQIALQHGYGDGLEQSCERQCAAVSRLLRGIPVHAYVALNIAGVPDLNDAIGGVDVTVLEDVSEDGIVLRAGEERHLSGKEAYVYVMDRDVNVFDSNSLREKRQKQYLSAYASCLKKKLKEDPTAVIGLYSAASDYMVTDIDLSRALYLAGELAGYEFSAANIESLPGRTVQGEVFEEYYLDDEAVRDMIVERFYRPVADEDE